VNPSEIASGLLKRSRHVPADFAREVYLRDSGCCTFRAASGRRCGATRFLEVDHVTPWAKHGEATVENLRLRCRAHNQHAAREYFGGEYVRDRVAARKRRKSNDGAPPRDATPKAGTGAS
jgi:5-methylcytosine-specific restriction endonuclease McrA